MKSIKLRLIITFSLVILVVTGFLGIFTVQVVSNDLRESSNLELLSLAVNNAELVRAKMDAEIHYMEGLAENPVVLSDDLSRGEIVQYMQAEAARAGYLAYSLVDMNGSSTVFDADGTTLDVSDRDYFQSAVKGQSAVSDIIISRATDPPSLVLIVAVPIYKDGEQVGVLYGRKDGNTLSDIAKGISYGETGYGYMVN